MPVPGSNTNPVPSRTLLESTSAGLFHPEVSTRAQVPSIALATSRRLVPIAMDEQFLDYSLPAQGATVSSVSIPLQTITFPNLPTPLLIPTNETLSYVVHVAASINDDFDAPIVGSPYFYKVLYMKNGLNLRTTGFAPAPLSGQVGEQPLPAGEVIYSWGINVKTNVFFYAGSGVRIPIIRFYAVAMLLDAPGH